MAITDFIFLNIPKEELSTALKVLHLFKEQESMEEWAAIPFHAWAKLEQLEEFLEHMVNNEPLRADTIRYIERVKEKKDSMPPLEGHHEISLDKTTKPIFTLPPTSTFGKANLTEWKPTATDITCKLVRCKGCHEQPRPTPCDKWYFNVIYTFIRIFNWR